MNSKTQIYFDPNDLHLGYIDSNGNPQHVLTDAFIKDGTIRVNNGYLEYKDAQGVWHTVIDLNGNPAYLTGPLGPVGDTGNTGPQGQLGVEGSKYVIAAGATDLNFREDATEIIRECGFRPGDFSISTSGNIWICNPDKKSFTKTVSIKGEDGVDGSTPQIGADGYWYIGGNKTSTKALGPKGDSGNGITAADAFEIKVLTTKGDRLLLGEVSPGDPVPVKLICEALPPGTYSIDVAIGVPISVSDDNDDSGICFLIAPTLQSTAPAVQVVAPGQVFTNNSTNQVYAICASAPKIISACKLDPPSGFNYWDWSKLNDIVSISVGSVIPKYQNIKINKLDCFSSANTSAIHTSIGATFYFNRVKKAPYYRHLLEEALQEGDYYLTFSEDAAMCKCFLKPFNTTGWSDLTEVKWNEWFRINARDAGLYALYIIPYTHTLYGFNIPDYEGVVPLYTNKADYKCIKGVQLYKRTAEITNITDSDEVVTISYSPLPGRPITQILLHKNGQPGKDGITPHIGVNGNWFIGEEDTSVKARGPQGDQGPDGRSIFVLDDVDRDALANIIGCSKSELLNLLIDNINSGNESIIASIKEFMKDAGLNWNDYLIIDNWVFLRYLADKPDGYDYTGRELIKNGEQGPGFRLLSEDEIESLARRIGQHRDSVLPTLLANANGVNPDESIMSGLPEFYSDLGMDNLDIFVFDGYSFQCQKYTEDGQVSLYTYSRISGEDGVDGVNGNTPQLKVEDGFWKVSYDNGDSWEQIAEYVGKSDINTINQELSQVSENVRTLSALTQGHESNLADINNLLFQGGDWFEDMEELSPEITGFDNEYSDIPHYIMYHNNILLKDINYESGELLEEESYPLYGEHEGYTDPAQITYNLYGDYCTVSVSNLLLINGWADIYFRLPVEPVEETNTIFMAIEGSEYQQVCCTVGHHDYPATGITEPVLWFRTCDADTYHTDYHISLTITYKYRNNEDF